MVIMKNMDISNSDSSSINCNLLQLTSEEHEKFYKILNNSRSNNLSISDLISQLHTTSGAGRNQDSESWSCKWTIVPSLVSGRPLARWGCAAAKIEGKLYLFGGRGTDSKTRSSCHVLELGPKMFFSMKTTNLPKPREGHSMIPYKQQLIVFGGCEGGEGETEPYNDVWVLDINTKSWDEYKTTGAKPTGRDGHAAGVIRSQMIIYGGSGSQGLLDDIFSMNLNTFEWKSLKWQGDHPGHRESMGFASTKDRLWIFGGNTSHLSSEVDEYTNDFFEIEIKNDAAICRRITSDNCPPKRLSHSMSPLNVNFLIVFGGECSTKGAVSDIWVYSIERNAWNEIKPMNYIPGRMAHSAATFKNSLFIFGGMGNEKIAKNEMAVLSFGKSKIEQINNKPVKKQLQSHMCALCGHSQGTCEFLKRFPEIGYPRMNFFCKASIPVSAIEGMGKEFLNDFNALSKICDIIGKGVVGINSRGTVNMRKGKIIKIIPKAEPMDFEFLPENQEDGEFDIRQKMLKSWDSSNLDTKVMVLEVSSKLELNPQEVGNYCVGTSGKNLLVPMMKLSPIAIIFSRTEEFLSIALIEKTDLYVPCFFIVFDKLNQPVYPNKDISQPNLMNILNRSHFNYDSLFPKERGTKIYLYPQEFSLRNHDITCNSFSLIQYFMYKFYKPPFPLRFVINSHEVAFIDVHKLQFTETLLHTDYKIQRTSGVPNFKVLIYRESALVYWEAVENLQNGQKRPRESDTWIIKLLNNYMISCITGQFKWRKPAMFMFADLGKYLKKAKLSDNY
ncbi:unnamed protein product [Blepharisma stoltei]|uniref:Uncharacterized protein n=1 Tax=Blepharisma stoltei TaxID=1481888 RepID=A0AAU9JAV2_9CILI|nr:unnamed protein product [Blepharisma stoltei]